MLIDLFPENANADVSRAGIARFVVSNDVPEALKGVDEVYSINGAFAGVFRDGKVVSGVAKITVGTVLPCRRH